MATQSPTPNLTRNRPEDGSGSVMDVALSVALHVGLVAAVFGAALFHHRGKSWGDQTATAGAIQATMVAALPLPAKRPAADDKVLASDTPTPAPVTATEKTAPPPTPNDIPIPEKTKPTKTADKPTPDAVKHPDLKPPPPNKAATGETSGMRIAQATMQLQNGTASASVQDSSFGARFAYYVQAVNRRVSQNWFTQEADPRASEGKRVTLLFDIDREGVPSNIRVETRSGSQSLDTSAIRAVQRVDAFGPLPQGDHITVEFAFDYKQQR